MRMQCCQYEAPGSQRGPPTHDGVHGPLIGLKMALRVNPAIFLKADVLKYLTQRNRDCGGEMSAARRSFVKKLN